MSTNLEIDDETAATLRDLVAAQNRSPSEIIHDALTAYAHAGKRVLPKGTGAYHSGRAEGSEKARDLIRDAVKEGQWP